MKHSLAVEAAWLYPRLLDVRDAQEKEVLQLLCVNTLTSQDKLWKRGEQPAHLLWGITQLPEHDIECEILPYSKHSFLRRASYHLFGNMDQQIRLLVMRPKDSVIYGTSQNTLNVLAFLHSLGLFRAPIVSVIRQPPGNSKSKLAYLLSSRGTSRLACMSRLIQDYFVSKLKTPEEKAPVLELGVDLDFFPLEDRRPEFIISAGKTGRDYNTLCSALTEIKVPTKIFCSAHSAPSVAKISRHIEVIFAHHFTNVISHKDLINWYHRAYLIAVPLVKSNNQLGLYSLLDAMAVAKPVVITRNPCIDIDVEAEGCGLWVNPGDVQGWREAIEYLLTNPKIAMEMGMRGRRLCEEKHNLSHFASQLAGIFRSVSDAERRGPGSAKWLIDQRSV